MRRRCQKSAFQSSFHLQDSRAEVVGGEGGEKAESSKEKKKNKNMQDVVSIQIPDNPHSICPRIPADVSEHLRSN